MWLSSINVPFFLRTLCTALRREDMILFLQTIKKVILSQTCNNVNCPANSISFGGHWIIEQHHFVIICTNYWVGLFHTPQIVEIFQLHFQYDFQNGISSFNNPPKHDCPHLDDTQVHSDSL